MPSVYTPTAVALTTITVPSDGDLGTAASVNSPLQALADAILAQAPLTRVHTLRDTLRSVAPISVASNPGTSTFSGLLGEIHLASGKRSATVNVATAFAWANLENIDDVMTHGKTLSSCVVAITPAGGHAALPQVMPAVAIVRSTRLGVASLLLAATWVTDASANVAAYEAAHDITFTPNQNNVIDRTVYSYSLVFLEEGGTNALVGLNMHSARMTFT